MILLIWLFVPTLSSLQSLERASIVKLLPFLNFFSIAVSVIALPLSAVNLFLMLKDNLAQFPGQEY
jgi:hypothetical protein